MFTSFAKYGGGLRQDALASVVVFLIALPLSMGVALASGMPVGTGLIAGAVGGLVAGLLGGAPLVVSGPTASLAVLVFDTKQRFGFAAVALVTALCGLLQIALGALRVGRFATAIPAAVLRGMLAGMGLVIAASQLTLLLGAAPRQGFMANLQALPSMLTHLNPQALCVGLVSFGILLTWPRLRWRLGIPAALVTIVVTSLLAYALRWQVAKVQLPDSLWQMVTFRMPAGNWLPLVGAALTIALIASAESLLSAVAVDKLVAGHSANLNRELFGQGAANFVSGMLGGLPIAGVIVRSTTNIEAGARKRWSTVLHGLWILLAASFLGSVLQYIPLAALAAMLIVVGLKLVSFKQIRAMYAEGELPIYLITLGGTLFFNLLAGIGFGLLACACRLGWRIARGQVAIKIAIVAKQPMRTSSPSLPLANLETP